MKITNKILYRNLIILVIAIIILVAIGIAITMARYRSTGSVGLSADVAFYVIEEGYQESNIMLSELYPSSAPFEYEFTVSNHDGTNISETTLDYNLELKMTTNLPLEIEIYKNGTKLTSTTDI